MAITYETFSRAFHSAGLATMGACGFLASAVLSPDSYKVRWHVITSYLPFANYARFQARYGCLIVATSGAFSCIPPLLGWLSANIHKPSHVGIAIALNISWGTPGQITGVWIYKRSERLIGYPTGHWVNSGLLFFVAVACLCLRLYYRFLNKRILRQDALGKTYHY
jgi:hypothetical protein